MYHRFLVLGKKKNQQTNTKIKNKNRDYIVFWGGAVTIDLICLLFKSVRNILLTLN